MHSIVDIQRRLERIQRALGRIEGRLQALPDPSTLADAEYQVFSQWGEDGIIQRLIRQVAIDNPTFVEFGVQDYTESNTRFLLCNNNWSGLVIDEDPRNIEAIKRDPIYWQHSLKAERAFIDRENINSIIANAGISGDIGLLSIDIDGNDLWVWEAITQVTPRILVLEYNAVFGAEAMVTIPYDPAFSRTRAHYSNLYWGASLAALTHVSRKKGYALVASNNAGNNAFYVRADLLGKLKEIPPGVAYTAAKFRESRDRKGNLTYLSPAEVRELIRDSELFDLRTNKTGRFQDLIG